MSKPMIQSNPRLDAYRLSRSCAHCLYPAGAFQPATKHIKPCQSSTLPLAKQLERSETKRETSTMQCMVDPAHCAARCAPDDPHHHILTLLGMGMAWRGMGIANEHEKGHLHQRRQASLRPKAVLSFSIWISRKSDVPSKSGTRQ